MTHEVPAAGVKEAPVNGAKVKWASSLRTREDIDALIDSSPLGVEFLLGHVIERDGTRRPIYTDYKNEGIIFEALAQTGELQRGDKVTTARIEPMGYMRFGVIAFDSGAGETEEEKVENIRTLINGIDKSLLMDFVGIDVSIDAGKDATIGLESYHYVPATGTLEKQPN